VCPAWLDEEVAMMNLNNILQQKCCARKTKNDIALLAASIILYWQLQQIDR
jgi:hypothetical protein